jgi:sugar-specific transcriptional regulator TrmB
MKEGRRGAGARDDEAQLLELMASFGFDRLTAQVYTVLLAHGPLPKRELLAVFSRPEQHLDSSLAALRDHRLVGVGYEHFRPRYYATDPSLAWQAIGTDLLWSGSSMVGSADAVRQASDPDAEARRGLCSQLVVVSGRLYRRHLIALTHREWDAQTAEELAQLVCEVISTARREILAVSTSPRLPDVAAFWTALTDRLSQGVRYRRVADLDELIAHGLRVVARDITEWRIALRVLERDRIKHKYYVVDDAVIALFHGPSPTGVRGIGRISRKHQIVWRYARRFPSYEQAAIPAEFVLGQLRLSADAVLDETRSKLGGTEVGWIESLADLGKFSQFHKEEGWSNEQLSAAEARATALGLVRRNVEGELVVAHRLTETQIRAAYETSAANP